MATPDILDFETLLAPIPGDNPAGADIREDASPASNYYKLKDARSAARAAERSVTSEEESSGLAEEWGTIIDLAPKVLREQTKDLEVAAWLTEALVRAGGFPGLRDGFKLILGLVEGFWDNLYPLEDEDGLETKVGPVSGLNGEGAEGTLIQPIRKVPLTDGSAGSFAAWHYKIASDVAQIADDERRQKRIDAGAPTVDKILDSVRDTPTEFFVDLVDDLKEAADTFQKMNDAFYERCGDMSPPYSYIRGELETVSELVQFLGRDKLAMAAPAAEPEAEEAAADGAAPAAGGGAAAGTAVRGAVGDIVTRDDAFRQLLKIAEFFRKNEPHSPIAYTLEEVVRRGRLPLAELLRELVPDVDARQRFLLASGIRPPTDEE
ncbi:MAG: type VI secretion system protein TssA [Rhodospirillaceae bacterium]|nr:type VI secretion system protein TssA [Rhodospirillaceae bacterium]